MTKSERNLSSNMEVLTSFCHHNFNLMRRVHCTVGAQQVNVNLNERRKRTKIIDQNVHHRCSLVPIFKVSLRSNFMYRCTQPKFSHTNKLFDGVMNLSILCIWNMCWKAEEQSILPYTDIVIRAVVTSGYIILSPCFLFHVTHAALLSAHARKTHILMEERCAGVLLDDKKRKFKWHKASTYVE